MGMRSFPRAVCEAMNATGSAVTCLPVKLESEVWETALFFRLMGPECKQDRRVLAKTSKPLPISFETDLLELQHAGVVTIRAEVFTAADDPLTAEILLTPGAARAHFDALKLLSEQPRLCWFFADEDFRVLHSQQNTLEADQHAGFDDLLRDAVRHDALIRSTGRYDAESALAEIAAHYELRAGLSHTSKGRDGIKTVQ